MKNFVIVLIVISVLGGGYWFYQNGQTKTPEAVNTTSPVSPTRLAEVNGYVTSIAGNEVVISNEIGVKVVTEEERLRRQKLSQEERQALKASESANLTKETVNLTIPVGVTVVKGSGDASGKNLVADISEIKKGTYLSIWKNGDEIEFVKLKGTN